MLSFVVDYHLKLALPMASFVFALFAAPLALLGRGGRSSGVVLSLVILLVYYVAVSVCRSKQVIEMLPPVVAAWLANTVFAVSGLYSWSDLTTCVRIGEILCVIKQGF